mmetsp:Transcript_8787/g.9606  ORF Transcript_8787/g.9606 Transcript_8787/m.9606 type:complete len:101 (+) Transcript_8787:14-316(+)
MQEILEEDPTKSARATFLGHENLNLNNPDGTARVVVSFPGIHGKNRISPFCEFPSPPSFLVTTMSSGPVSSTVSSLMPFVMLVLVPVLAVAASSVLAFQR